MRITLDEQQQRELRKRPEDGMGYQRADVTLPDGRRMPNAIVYNGREVDVPTRPYNTTGE